DADGIFAEEQGVCRGEEAGGRFFRQVRCARRARVENRGAQGRERDGLRQPQERHGQVGG
ncbi:unnamed protein product, partial [Ectocarpus sp. 12 AP-2014]